MPLVVCAGSQGYESIVVVVEWQWRGVVAEEEEMDGDAYET